MNKDKFFILKNELKNYYLNKIIRGLLFKICKKRNDILYETDILYNFISIFIF